MLTSDEAAKEFLSTLRERFNIEGGIRGWYIARRAMERYHEKERTQAQDGPDQYW